MLSAEISARKARDYQRRYRKAQREALRQAGIEPKKGGPKGLGLSDEEMKVRKREQARERARRFRAAHKESTA
ncbi:hypothetical protein SAMN02799631_05182 [Methylobacterium sp. 174MFSha1.1]|uniref:hypothetical protein n=1 Tax=Methylobacterium sp. 174MFSha1.1 TaxID=1502749 RepID=UPI0008DF9125|nr:hypothetical protein [Methylobacterium sp. 174MFSha1.1]SFV11001.1 hypothetical protein SAMN02799631_05182 [Methylobacterium sp. 174MFSha1.1]